MPSAGIVRSSRQKSRERREAPALISPGFSCSEARCCSHRCQSDPQGMSREKPALWLLWRADLTLDLKQRLFSKGAAVAQPGWPGWGARGPPHPAEKQRGWPEGQSCFAARGGSAGTLEASGLLHGTFKSYS